MRRSDFRVQYTMPIQWGDMDAIGHVNNVTFFRYIETGRVQYGMALQAAFPDIAWNGVVGDIQCRYHRQLRFPADIDIAVRISRLGQRSYDFTTGIFLHGSEELIASSVGRMVCFDHEAQQSMPLSPAARAAICEFEPVPPEQ